MYQEQHTIKEYEENFQMQLLNLDQQHRKNKFNLEDIADFLPLGVLLNHKKGNNVFMNKLTCQALNCTLDEIKSLGVKYSSSILFNEDELLRATPQINALYQSNDQSKLLPMYQRIRPLGSNFHEWVFNTSKLFLRHGEDVPCQRILTVIPVRQMGNMSNQINRVLDENNYMRKHFKKFALLTKREKEIITLVANGSDNPLIAEKLFISRRTVEQHRKNIRRKLGFKHIFEILKFAEAFELV